MNYAADIKGIKEDDTGTYLIVHIPDKQVGNKLSRYKESGAVKTLLYFDDARRISIKQMQKIYALLAAISMKTGHTIEELKIVFKIEMIKRFNIDYFSLSPYEEHAANMETARLMINMLIDHCFTYEVATKDTLLDKTDDVTVYLYLSLKYRKCALCQQKGEVHHVDTIGMGRNRNKLDDKDHRKICLCRKHHTEAHLLGVDSFFNKYHVYGILFDEKNVKEWDEIEVEDIEKK